MEYLQITNAEPFFFLLQVKTNNIGQSAARERITFIKKKKKRISMLENCFKKSVFQDAVFKKHMY